MKYIFGLVPSRRLGISLGVSPIPKKTCNYSCIYCQLGKTDHMTNTRQMFFSVTDIIYEFEQVLKEGISIDLLETKGFHSGIKDDYEAILSIIKRHPMNQFEI